MAKKYIKKILLSDGKYYYVRDETALQNSGGTITGDLTIDGKIETEHLYIMSIENTEDPVDNLLTIDDDGKIKKRDSDDILSDIGGCSYGIASTGVLQLKIGK